MREGRRDQKAGDQECGDRARRDVGITVRDVVQHGEPQERIAEAQDGAGDDARPVRHRPVAGEGEPQQRHREEPDGDEGCEEARFGSVVAVLQPVAPEEVCLHGHEAERHGDAC